jgi:hypothetical protein
VNPWINKTIDLNDSWGLGATDILQNPVGTLPEFSIRPRYLRDSQGVLQLAHFGVEFPSGYLADGWQGANFTPMGTLPVTGISDLPPWDPSQQALYRQVINAAIGSLGDSRTARLEGVIPYLGSGGVGYDTVRLFYVPNAVVGGSDPDLIVVKTATFAGVPGTVQARQDGSAHGQQRGPGR